MTAQRRLAVATRGFRGTFGINNYINETLALDEGLVNIDIVETVPVATIEVVSVEVSSLDVEGAF
tara:strand:- start:82 stop:276 length:195 start_codon:yes stop_codon:yes gene_type:complete